MTLYLANVRYLDHRTGTMTPGELRVERGAGGAVTLVDAIPDGAERIDCGGRLVTHSFVVAHHHLYSSLARGMPPPTEPPISFVQILERVWWRLDKALDREMIRACALVGGLDAALSGTTMVIDHHASPNAAGQSLHIIAGALEEIGLSHLLCYELSDRDGPERLEEGFEETRQYLAEHQGLVGLHASFTVSDRLLARAVELAQASGTGVHVHVAEAPSDQEDCLARFGVRCVERFARAGVLEMPASILAHCIHLDGRERELIRDGRAWVSQQSQSNQNNAVGALDGRAFEDSVMIGTDGMGGDCLAATRASFLAAQAVGGLSPAGAYRRLRRVHEYVARNGLAGDGANNLVVLGYDEPTPITDANWPAHVVYGLDRSHVHTVISDGRVIVRDGRSTLVDEAQIAAYGREQAARLWARL